MARRVNGEGTIYRRKDGRYEAKAWVETTSGITKRVSRYGKTRSEAHEKLTAALAQRQRGIPIPDRSWKLGDYLGYWLGNVVRRKKRPKTYELYELTVRHYLKPGLGSYSLTRLSVPIVQTFLNQKTDEGHSLRKVQVMRTVLSSALTSALREELVTRNVARLVELPTWHAGKVRPWSVDEAKAFLTAAESHAGYAGYVLLMLYGLRRGEVLGLRWCDVDFTGGIIHVRQQLQRLTSGLYQGPVKTKSGQRDLPLVGVAREVLTARRAQQDAERHTAGGSWLGGDSDERLVFTTASGHSFEPQNFVRSFHRICRQHGIRRIKVHHVRHTQATLLEYVGASVREAQLILGHSNVSTTQQIY